MSRGRHFAWMLHLTGDPLGVLAMVVLPSQAPIPPSQVSCIFTVAGEVYATLDFGMPWLLKLSPNSHAWTGL